MSEQEIKSLMTELLEGTIKKQILLPRPSLTYNGQPKPVDTRYQRPLPSPRSATGQLANSVNVYFESDLEDGELNLVVDFGLADYWEWVNYGRRPSTKYPPLSIIQAWVQQKPALQYPGLSINSRAFLAARSIKEYGYYGINFIEASYKELENDLIDLLGQYGAEYFTKVLEDERIIIRSETNRP
jgi:hypothetical protein